MINENHELIMELWSRLKAHIPPKERLEVADILIIVFDEFGLVSDEILEEDLDKEILAAVKSHLVEPFDEDEQDDIFYDE